MKTSIRKRKNFLAHCAALLILCLAAAPVTLVAGQAGDVAFVTQGRSYLGRYSPAEEALSVEIDGLVYRGHYAAQADAAGASSSSGAAVMAGQWGRAFLFASSAKVLQCQLATPFPQVSGQCLAADGRQFELKPALRP